MTITGLEANPRRRKRQQQSGVALITVLLIVFLASITATSLASLQQFSVRRSAVLAHQQQARLYVLGAEQWAGRILARDRRSGERDHLGEEWASMTPLLPVAGGAVSGSIEDLQGRFNVNNLIKDERVEETQLALFRRLLDHLRLEPDLAQAVADWIDSDQEMRFPGGAEDSTYLQRGYLSADRTVLSITELRLIEGIDEQVFAMLEPHVTALPDYTKINVNTATAPVLAALDEQFDLNTAEVLIAERAGDGFAGIGDFLQAAGLPQTGLNDTVIGVSSAYFVVSARAEVGVAQARLKSLLKRTANGAVAVQMRSFGQAL